MKAVEFQRDIERRPEVLRSAAQAWAQEDPWSGFSADRIIFLGMGSSHFAADVAAARLQHLGVPATAVIASSDLPPRIAPGDHIIAISAGGKSIETLAAVRALAGSCPITVITNAEGGPMLEYADRVVPMRAEVETSGVACRSFTHTQALLLLLQGHLGPGFDSRTLIDAADAMQDLIASSPQWLSSASDLLLGPDGTATVAPVSRLSSARQSALMLREGPRLLGFACETGDWSHIDVYLTKTRDYRMLLIPGSQWDAQLMDWCTQRGSTVVAVGAEVPGAALSLRYRGDEDDTVRLLADITVAELVSARAWQQAP